MSALPTAAPAIWLYPHRTVAETDDLATKRWWADRTAHHQPAPRRDDDGGEGAAVGGSVHNGEIK